VPSRQVHEAPLAPPAPTQVLGPTLVETIPLIEQLNVGTPGFFHRTGESWSEDQWLAKALELVGSYSGMSASLPRPSSGRKPPLPPGSPSAGKHQTAKATMLRYRSNQGKLVEVNLIEAIEHHGLNVMPDWYSSLDRIYQVRDMAVCSANPEPPVPLSGLLGAPGHSYVVPSKSPRSRPGSQHQQESLDESQPDEETMRRYRSNLVATNLSGVHPVMR
ncbi:unnamed protein product, partial [Polarella glacialis]